VRGFPFLGLPDAFGNDRELRDAVRPSLTRQLFQGRTKAKAPIARQCRPEHLGAIVRKRTGETAGHFVTAEQGTDERIGISRVLIGTELAFPRTIAKRIGADGPEIGTTSDQDAVTKDEHAVIAAFHAVEHVNVDGVEPVLHRQTAAPGQTIQSMPASVEDRA
jgi:hypothetical protein